MQLQALKDIAFAGTSTKDKGPPVADGILSVAPDTPDVVERRKRGVGLDCVETSSRYLEDGDPGAALHLQPVCISSLRRNISVVSCHWQWAHTSGLGRLPATCKSPCGVTDSTSWQRLARAASVTHSEHCST